MAFILSLFLTILSVFSCSNQQKNLQKVAMTEPIITLEKERTRGDRAPRYKVEIFDQKVAKYTGLANVSVMGEALIELEKKEYKAILKELEMIDFKALKTSYKGGIRDLPLTSISIGAHKVTYNQVNCPKELNGLAMTIEKIVSDEVFLKR